MNSQDTLLRMRDIESHLYIKNKDRHMFSILKAQYLYSTQQDIKPNKILHVRKNL